MIRHHGSYTLAVSWFGCWAHFLPGESLDQCLDVDAFTSTLDSVIATVPFWPGEGKL